MPEVVEERARPHADPRSPPGAAAAHLPRRDGGATGASAVIERTIQAPRCWPRPPRTGSATACGRLTDPSELAAATDDLSRHQALIADGHHRWATYLRLREEQSGPGPWNYGLVLLIDTAEYPPRSAPSTASCTACRWPTPRRPSTGRLRCGVLEGASSLTSALEVLADAAGGGGNAFVLAGDGGFTLVDRPDPELLARTASRRAPEPWRTLDATVLHATMLDHLWHVSTRPSTSRTSTTRRRPWSRRSAGAVRPS